jgi:predicted ATPase
VGGAGIGKSRLLREVATLAEASGFVVVTGRATPAAANSAYRPLTEALQQLLRYRDVPADEALARWLPPLGPVLSGVVPDVEQTVAVAVRAEAVLQLIRRVAPEGVVVVLEDLHWADRDTIGVIEYLVDNVEREAVLVAVSLRPEPPTPGMDLVSRRRSSPGFTLLTLGRLDDRATTAMLAACGTGASADHLEWVARTAEGIPLLIEDLLASPGLPDSITSSVRERLEELPAHARKVIEAAAVMGRNFDWQLLAEASGASPGVVSDALARAVGSLLLISDGDTFRFRHALTSEAVVAMMLPPVQREVAARALKALASAHPRLEGGWRDVAADLATRAGERRRAGILLLESGEASLRMGALATARETLRRALDLL